MNIPMNCFQRSAVSCCQKGFYLTRTHMIPKSDAVKSDLGTGNLVSLVGFRLWLI